MVRVIGGMYKGRKIKTLEGSKTRPTPSIVREALFDILSERIKGAYFLDLYAGFGCIGIEALSRGAAFVSFVEKDSGAASLIKKNLVSLGLEKDSQVLVMDVIKSLRKIKLNFDYIFLDPPYSENPFVKIFELLSENDILSENGKIIIQSFKKTEFVSTAFFVLEKAYKYGDTSLLFFRRKGGKNET